MEEDEENIEDSPDYDPFRIIPGSTDCLEYFDRLQDIKDGV
tara:strand:- start:27970 stop:28092 length:123 start_codon:yes stop_codon:yes gene_type:complete